MDLSGFNIWELLVAAVGTVILGIVWYSPRVLGNIWQKEMNISDERLNSRRMPLVYVATFFLSFITATVLSLFVEIFLMLGAKPFSAGFFAIILALLFIGTFLGIIYLISARSWRLYLIDLGFVLLAFFIMGMVIGAWY